MFSNSWILFVIVMKCPSYDDKKLGFSNDNFFTVDKFNVLNSKFEYVFIFVIKIFVLKILVLKNGFTKI